MKYLHNFNKFTSNMVNEASLSRVMQHAQNGFAILTAFRGEYDLKENRKRNQKLEKKIRDKGYGFTKVEGHWVENMDDPNKPNLDVIEESLFIPIGDKTEAEFEQDVMEFITFLKPVQDAAVIKVPSNQQVELIFNDGSRENIGTFHPNRIAQAYSRMKGKTFIFEGIQVIK